MTNQSKTGGGPGGGGGIALDCCFFSIFGAFGIFNIGAYGIFILGAFGIFDFPIFILFIGGGGGGGIPVTLLQPLSADFRVFSPPNDMNLQNKVK